MKNALIFILFLAGYQGYSQTNAFDTAAPETQNRPKPFSRENPHNTFAIKGIGYVNLLEGGFGWQAGLEKGFLKNHSFGLKYEYDHATPHREDTEGNNDQTIDYSHNKNRAYVLQYKYYFDFRFLSKLDVSPYASLIYRTGSKTYENDREFPHSFYYREMKYNYIGPSLGTLIIASESKKWAVDVQLGYLFGRKKVYTESATPENTSYATDRWLFDLMIAYNFDW